MNAQGTALTYQGRLNDAGQPANGFFDLRFILYDSSSGGNVVAGPITNSATDISNGLFTVPLDFGPGVFTGASRWLDIGVRTNGVGAFTALAGRQELTAAPYAILAGDVSLANNTVARLNVSNTTTTATGVPVVTSGFITGATVTSGGSGYTAVPAVTVNDTTGSGAIITAAIANDMVISLTVHNAGSGYSSNATLTIASPPNNAYQVFSGTNFFTGVNALSNTNNTFTGAFNGNGLGLTALNSAALQGPIAASNLTSVPAASLTGTIPDARLSSNVPLLITPNTAVQATAQLDISGGQVQDANLINYGSGYYSPPAVYINDPTGIGFGASGYAELNSVGGGLLDIVVSGGFGYSASTTISIAPPPASYPVFAGSVGWGFGPSQLTANQGGAIELGDSTLNNTSPYIDFHHGANLAVQQDYDVRLINNAAGQLSVLDAYTALPDLVIKSGGLVGVGTTNPLTALHAKSASGQCEVSIESGDAGGHRWTLQSTGVQALPASFQIIDRTEGVARFLINTNGLIGIGTTAPDATLSVNGTADKPGGGSWGTFSDARLKDIGANFTHGLDALSAIQPVHYHYKSDNPLNLPSQPDYVGVVAQQVQKTVPEAVQRSDNGYLVVNNDPILWTMFNAIKELKAENDTLKHRIEHLETEAASR